MAIVSSQTTKQRQVASLRGRNNNNNNNGTSSGGGRKQNKTTNKQTNQRWSMTFWIAIFMATLLACYLVIVLTVAVTHWPTAGYSYSSSEDADEDAITTDHTSNKNMETDSKIQQRWNRIKEQRGLGSNNEKKDKNNELDNTDGNNNEPEKKKKKKPNKNPIRLHHLENPLNHGVKPDKLLHSDHSVTAIKDDPPIQQHPTPDYVLTAYLERLNFDDWTIKPLPDRTTTTAQADQLTKVQYTRLTSCSKLPQQFPIDDSPVDTDSYLPWIHDVFPTHDGTYIQIVAQNKRRCKNGSKEKDILHQQQPQASLFQHVSVKRVNKKVDDDNNNDGDDSEETRYRLCSHEEADPDGIATRFICRFRPDQSETLSEFNFNYDWTAYRKRYKNSFIEDDAGIKAIHSSQLTFRCPVPDHLVETVRSGESVQDDWASLFLDLIPIRTPPRFGPPDQYFPPVYQEFQNKNLAFDPHKEWGDNHVLPKIEDSGRWENIPICKPSLMTYNEEDAALVDTNGDVAETKTHRLVSCIWASAGYTTRGNRFAINDGQRRLLEWITYNKLIGFDHVFLYDNSGAFDDTISLKAIADLFPDDVTYIPWPAQICNNNPNNVDSVGERSSQYAAEASCRLRFGPHVEWIGQFDIDEYLVPMGKYDKITSLLDKLEEETTKIISFASWRAWPRWAFIDTIEKIQDPEICWHNEPCFELKVPYRHTMLQTYNCDRQKPGEKTSRMPAEKQLYKPDYVLAHFVHYSVATVQSEKNKTEYVKDGFGWKGRAFPDPRQRFGNELTEALMVHTKAVARQDTVGWERVCHINNTFLPKRRQGLCRLGVPYPDDWTPAKSTNATEEGWAYNCYVNPKVENQLIPKLNKALEKYSHFFDTQ